MKKLQGLKVYSVRHTKISKYRKVYSLISTFGKYYWPESSIREGLRMSMIDAAHETPFSEIKYAQWRRVHQLRRKCTVVLYFSRYRLVLS